jgi:hypothetical protein
MELKDYLHLYLGCQMQANKSGDIYTLAAVFTNGTIQLAESSYKDDFFDFKPILRQLSGMTDEEKQKAVIEIYGGGSHWNDVNNAVIEFDNEATSNVAFFYYLLRIHIDLFGLIELGLAIDAATISK